MSERYTWEDRSISPHRSPAEALQGPPAQMLLDRLDTPTIVVGLDGVVVYANPACERLLGYQTAGTLEGQPLRTLLGGPSEKAPIDWIDLLSDPDTVTNWNHSDGYPVATLACDPVTLQTTHPMFMVSLLDVSDQMWSAVDRAYRYSPQRGE
jgi:PAS domain-containing protein